MVLCGCSAPRLGFTEALIVAGFVIFAGILYILCSFILFIKEEPHLSKARAQRKRPSKFLTNSGLIFITIILLSIGFYLFSVARICTQNAIDDRIHSDSSPFNRFTIALQRDITQCLWFSQSHYILNGTTFRFHRRCSVLFGVIFCLNIITNIINAVYTDSVLWFWCSITLYLVEILFLSISLFSKLCALYNHYNAFPFSLKESRRAHRDMRARHDHLEQRVTRVVVLYSVSLSTVLLTVTAVFSNRSILSLLNPKWHCILKWQKASAHP